MYVLKVRSCQMEFSLFSFSWCKLLLESVMNHTYMRRCPLASKRYDDDYEIKMMMKTTTMMMMRMKMKMKMRMMKMMNMMKMKKMMMMMVMMMMRRTTTTMMVVLVLVVVMMMMRRMTMTMGQIRMKAAMATIRSFVLFRDREGIGMSHAVWVRQSCTKGLIGDPSAECLGQGALKIFKAGAMLLFLVQEWGMSGLCMDSKGHTTSNFGEDAGIHSDKSGRNRQLSPILDHWINRQLGSNPVDPPKRGHCMT